MNLSFSIWWAKKGALETEKPGCSKEWESVPKSSPRAGFRGVSRALQMELELRRRSYRMSSLRLARSIAAYVLTLVIALSTSRAAAQSLFGGDWNPLEASPQGFHIRQAWLNTTYFSNGLGGSQFSQLSGSSLTLQGDAATSAGASFGWLKRRPHSSFSLNYSPSYTSRLRYSQLNSFGHTANFSATGRLARWTFTGAMNTSINNLAQFLSQPPVFESLSFSTSTLQQLTQAVTQGSGQSLANFLLLSAQKQPPTPPGPTPITNIGQLPAGNVSNDQLASLLTGAPILKTAGDNSMYNTQALNAGVNAEVTFEWTPRTSISGGVTGSRTQYLSGGSAGQSRTIPEMMSTGVHAGVHHSLSSQSSVGVTVTSSRQISTIQDSSTSSGSIYFDRTFFRRWFVRGDVGVSKMDAGRHLYALPSGIQKHWGASLGFQTRAQTFLGSVQQMAGDPYGIGGGSTRAITGAWNWHPYAKPWTVFASVSQQDIRSLAFSNIQSWNLGGGLVRRLNSSLNLQTQYTALWYQGTNGPLPYNLSFSTISVGLAWRPMFTGGN